MRLKTIEKKIEKIKSKLLLIQDMRPGSLSKQYSICGKPTCRCVDPKNPKKHGPYHQLSYAHKGRNTTKFIQAQYFQQIKRELQNYRKFKALCDQWIVLALQASQEKIDIEKTRNMQSEK